MKNVAIIGIGRWGKLLIKEFDNISNVKFCHFLGSKNNAKWLKKYYPKIESTQNIEDILKSDVDAVVIATPLSTHFKISQQILQNNKHVFVEKPIATTKKDAIKLIALAKKKQLVLFVGHIFLHHPVFKKINIILKNDTIQFAKFDWNKTGTFNEDIFLNLLSHELSIILELFGTPLSSHILYSKGVITDVDQLIVDFDFSKNRKCLVNINRCSNFKNKSILLKTKKKILLWENDDLFEFDQKNMKYNLIFRSKEEPLKIECKQFLQSLKTLKYEKMKLDISYKVVQILDDLIKKLP